MGSNLTIDKILTVALPGINQQCKELTERQMWEPGLHGRVQAFVTKITWLDRFTLHCTIPGFQYKQSFLSSTVEFRRF